MLEIGGGLGVLSRVPGGARRARACGRDRRAPAAMRCATRTDSHENVSVHWGDAMQHRPRGARAVADEGRREPALRHRGGAALAHDRAAARRDALGGDGPARGRRAIRGQAGRRRVRRAVGARAARLRGARSCGRSRARCFTRCRTSTRCCVRPRTPRGRRRDRIELRALVRNGASPTGARRWPARSRCPAGRAERRDARAGARGARASSAIPPTCAPSASHPRTSARSRGCSERDDGRPPRAGARPREDQPRAVPRTDSRARTAGTSW